MYLPPLRRVLVYADFSHTIVVPKLPEGQQRIFHEETLRNQVAQRLASEERKVFVQRAEAGWSASKDLAAKKAPPEQRYNAWLEPFTRLLTEDDIKADTEEHWSPNPHFETVTRAIAQAMGYTQEEKMPLTVVSGALTPMVRQAMAKWFGPLLSDVIDLDIKALNIEKEDGVFTGALRSVDQRVYGGAAAYGDSQYLLLGDHYMRLYGFGDHLVVIYEPDGTCNYDAIQTQLSQQIQDI